MGTFNTMQSVLVGLLVAGSASVAAGMGNNPGGCNGPPGGLTDGGACPPNCFDTPSAQTIKVQGGPSSDWVVGISQCIKPSGSISFITYGPPDANGECSVANSCGSNKVEDIAAGATFVDLVVPAGRCEGDPICVYVHDGQLKKGSGGTPEANVPADCFSSPNQLCALCGSYLVTPRLVGGEVCTDPYSCTTGDTCGADGVCSGTPDDTICDDSTTCTEDICVAGRAIDGIDGQDLLADGSGCGYRPDAANACDDGFSCTNDLCVALPSVPIPADAPAGSAGDATSGCFFDKDDAQCPAPQACATVECVAGSPLHPPGSGCTYTEKTVGGEGFCAAKYGDCAAAVCVDVDTPIAGGTVDADGCSIRAQSDADAACPQPVNCGEASCDLSAGVTGSGCSLIFDTAAADAQCRSLQQFECQDASCEAGGECQITPNNAKCNDGRTCTEDICVAGRDLASLGILEIDYDDFSSCGRKEQAGVCDDGFSCTDDSCGVLPSTLSGRLPDPTTGCVSEANDAVCSPNYDKCAGATCSPGMGADADGCMTLDQHTASSACMAPECGSVECSLAALAMPGYGTGADGDGCTVTSVDADCTDAPCKLTTCVDGTCTPGAQSAQDTFCETAILPNADCVTKSCAADSSTATDASGCVAAPTTPSPCTVTAGFCGTSVCSSTGECTEMSEVCTGCTECIGDSCQGPGTCDSTLCQTCDTMQSPPVCTGSCPSGCQSDSNCGECEVCNLDNNECEVQENLPCSVDGASCFCNSDGECDLCITPCPDTDGECANTDTFRGCAELERNPGQSTCGARTCTILCQQKCGGTEDYGPSQCSNPGGCQCDGPSALDPAETFQGPCCLCSAECPIPK